MHSGLPSQFKGFANGFAGNPSAGGISDPTVFEAFTGSSGYSNLASAVTINSISVDATNVYLGYSIANWGSLTGSGTDPTSALSPLTNTNDVCRMFNNGKYYQQASSATNDLVAQDLMIELVMKATSTGATTVFAKRQAGAGYSLTQSGGTYTFTISNGATTNTITFSLTTKSWNVVHIFYDSSDTANTGFRVYVNGVSANNVTHTALATATSASLFTLGALPDGTNPARECLAYLSLFASNSWFAGGSTNTTHWQAMASGRCHRVFGSYAIKGGNKTPTVATRSTVNYLDRYTNDATESRTLFLVGPHWMRVSRRKEDTGGELITGFLTETNRTNLCLQSETFDDAAWTKTNSTISAEVEEAPNLDITADGLTASVLLSSSHLVEQAITLTATTYTFSVFAKVGNKNFVRLENATAACHATFNLSTGAVAGTSGSVTASMMPWVGGYYRCRITYTGTAAAHTHRIYACTDASNTAYMGDGSTISISIFGGQCELAPNVTSYIPTTTVSVLRQPDVLRYSATNNVPSALPWTMSAKTLINSNANTDKVSLSINNAGYTIYTQLDWLVTSGHQVGRSGVQVNITSVLSPGEINIHTSQMNTNNTSYLIDGASVGNDTSNAPPVAADVTLIEVGASSGGSQPNGLVSSIKLIRGTVNPS